MKANILNFVLFSMVICSFEYAKKELYYVNERSIYREKNIIYFRNNRILADADKQFDFNDFYKSNLNFVSQYNDYDYDDKENVYLRNIIDSHVKKHKESNTTPNLNNVDGETKKLLLELRKDIEEVKKEIDNKRNGKLAAQSIQNKKISKKYKDNSAPEHASFKEFEHEKNNEVISRSNNELENDAETRKSIKRLLKKGLVLAGISLGFLISGGLTIPFIVIITLVSFDTFKKLWSHTRSEFKKTKILKILK
ncbi:fam-b protein [Plasmodium vinckei brucechwatti]|uniref:Fam-b protein n=1 Tax=Plasmodium vinckei brucechwatti TaxID=119398 RepID=A0A6V7S6Q2_PLAVN|nr:fam-b protein [Plasmodium vinckei brucechwatti]